MINLGDKNWGVKDSGLLAYKQVGSKYFNKDFDFTRASSGTYIDKNGVLQTAEVYNLLSYSQDFEQSYWLKFATDLSIIPNATISPFGVQNASKLVSGSTNAQQAIYRSLAVTNTTFSVYAKKAEFSTLSLKLGGAQVANFDLENGTIGYNTNVVPNIESVGNDWYRCSISYSGASSYAWISINSGNTQGDEVSGIYIYGAQLVEGTEPRDYQYTNGLQGLPRISYENGVGHLLLEPQRSNLITYSEDFSEWILYQINAPVPNQGTSPDGNNNATKIFTSINRVKSVVYKGVSGLGNITRSVFAKKGTADYMFFDVPSSNAGVWFNLSTGEVGTVNSGTATIEDYGNGWYRCSCSANYSSSAFAIGLSDADNSTAVTGGKDILIWGAQSEEASYATSYIKSNSGTTTTRNADVCNNSGTEQDFNSEEGVLYAEIAALADGGVRKISISDGSVTNYISFEYSVLTNLIRIRLVSGGVEYSFYQSTSYNYLQYHKIAISYKINDFKIYIDGLIAHTDTSSIMPIGLNVLNFSNGNNNEPFYGKVRSVKYFPTALTDDELEALTT